MTSNNDRVRSTLKKLVIPSIAVTKAIYSNGSGLIIYRSAVFIVMTVATILLGLVTSSVWRSEAAIVGVNGRIDVVVGIVASHKERIDDHEGRLRYVERGYR